MYNDEVIKDPRKAIVKSDAIKIVLGAFVGALFAFLLIVTLAGGVMGGMGQMMDGSMTDGVLRMLFWLVFWYGVAALLIALVVWLVKQTRGH